jgi:hypothetical protein
MLLSRSRLTLRCGYGGESDAPIQRWRSGDLDSRLLLRWETHGDYRIVATMPDRDGHRMYRIKSPLEEYERAVKEDLLAKSNGYLPEEVPARVSRRRSITLSTLQLAS